MYVYERLEFNSRKKLFIFICLKTSQVKVLSLGLIIK